MNEEEVYRQMIEPVTSNLMMMRKLAKTKKENKTVDTLEWFFGLRELPKAATRQKIYWRFLDLWWGAWYWVKDRVARGSE